MNRRRVVITGIGIISSIGHNARDVLKSLYFGHSGIAVNPTYKENGLLSHISGQLPDPISIINDKKTVRCMSNGAGYSFISMQQALADANLPEDIMNSPRTGMIIGTGGASPAECIDVGKKLSDGEYRKISPFASAKCMVSSATANLDVIFKIKGVTLSVASACASSAHAIGEAFDKIAFGRLDTVFAGGCDENDFNAASPFDRAKALSRANADPEKASRPYDKNRDGFVVSGGGGMIVLEELDQARNRGAKIYAEIIGYGASSDGYHMTEPSGEGAVRCMSQAIEDCDGLKLHEIDYINTHGTSTLAGDIAELHAIKEVFNGVLPLISSTKSLTGHALGAAGVHELIYSIIMMKHNFIAGSANIEDIDEDAKYFPIVRKRMEKKLKYIMSNSFGFGGTNATLIIKKT